MPHSQVQLGSKHRQSEHHQGTETTTEPKTYRRVVMIGEDQYQKLSDRGLSVSGLVREVRTHDTTEEVES